MTTEQSEKIVKMLADIDIDVTAEDIQDIDNLDELEEYLQDNDYFNVEIIYYSRAMEYLSEHDNSLNRAFELASDMGYEVKNLNSEILASLVARGNICQKLQ